MFTYGTKSSATKEQLVDRPLMRSFRRAFPKKNSENVTGKSHVFSISSFAGACHSHPCLPSSEGKDAVCPSLEIAGTSHLRELWLP